ncbi:TPA: IcmT/TraK family protein [Escherichia coli]|nr:IcmT/TraK family protein [Escherichia coli]
MNIDDQAWRNTGRIVRFFGIDGRAMILLILAIYYISWITIGILAVGILGLVLLENMKYTIPNAYRALKVLIAGKYRPAVVSKRLGRTDR